MRKAYIDDSAILDIEQSGARHMIRRVNHMTNQAPQSQQPPIVVVQGKTGPGCLTQALWFLFVGWWLGAILITAAWFLNITIIGLPLGMSILNNIPKILALQEPNTQTRAITSQGKTIISETAERET